jgi:hypothetical protein
VAHTSSGKRVLVEPEPSPTGSVGLLRRDGQLVAVFIHPSDDWTGTRYVSHFLVCPKAERYRKAGG